MFFSSRGGRELLENPRPLFGPNSSMDRQDLKAQLTKTQELLSIAIKEKDTADMILEALGGFLGRRVETPFRRIKVVWPKIGMLLGVGEIFRDSIR